MKKKKASSTRLRFPDDEKRFAWLPLLLDAFHGVEKELDEAIRKEERSRGKKRACVRGCDICCRFQKDIPVYPLEMTGIYWYCIEKLEGVVRDKLTDSLAAFRNTMQCPFLIDAACAIHPFRPIGCRLFNVFGERCAEGEDPFETRNPDLYFPDRKITDRAWRIMLPFYGFTDEKVKTEVIAQGLMHGHAQVLQSLNWGELAKRMREGNRRKAE